MRSRSSRLFIVLLHLVGVSTNLPAKLWDWNVGIVGAHPMAVLLERLELESAGGLDGLLRRLRGAGYDVDGLLEEPYWLQDDADGKCMGPGGFSECGDATLWLVRRKPARRKKGRRGVLASVLNRRGDEDDDVTSWIYALQLIDANPAEARGGGRIRRSKKMATAECLVASGGGRKRGRQQVEDGGGGSREKSARLVPCDSDDAWGWRVDGDGVLAQDGEADVAKGGGRGSTLMGVYGTVDPPKGRGGAAKKNAARQCLHRSASTTEVAPCSGGEGSSSPTLESSAANASNATSEGSLEPRSRVVRFSLIRYQAGGPTGAAAKLPKFSPSEGEGASLGEGAASPSGETKPLRRQASERNQDYTTSQPQRDEEESSHLPHRSSRTSSHASGPMMHPDLPLSSQLLFTNVGTANPPKRKQEKKKQQLPSGTGAQERMRPAGQQQSSSHAAASRSMSSGRGGGSALPRMGGATSSSSSGEPKKKHNLLHKSPAPKLGGGSSSPSLQQDDDAPHKPRKIPTHPYIANVKSPGVWEDPQTGLEYLTDLSGYLGHDRKEKGRHTLMGVGLYTRTVFNIKVYGCAFYATKRDVLADPGYAPFAAMMTEELQGNEDFYDHLMSFPPSEEGAGVDRTLFLKMNMQLATETMRTSLDADWSLMTTEQKDLLINSSFEERPADERMLAKIKSKENTSRCSCGQSAPPEYEADPECCARGTELAFTWHKNGDLELRIDRRLMDRFTNPGLGKSIFYEYLRGDEPMSMAARNNFADGFPFLLAPLAQVKGVSSPVRQQEGGRGGAKEESSIGVVRFFGNMAGAVGSQAAAATGWVQGGAAEVVGNVVKTTKAVGDTARNLGAEMEKKRSATAEHIMSLPEQGSQFVMSLMPFKKSRGEKVFELRVLTSDGSVKTGWDNVSNESLQSILGGPVVQDSGRGSDDASSPMSDEIGVIKHPTMNFTHQLFLYTVHLYLMLLLIVSVPRSYTTKLRVKRAGSSRGSSDDESVDSILCASPDEKPSRSSRLRGMEVEVPLQMPLLGRSDQEQQRNGHVQPQCRESGEVLAADRNSDDREVGRRRETSPPEQVTEMKKAFSYFL